MKRFWDKVNIGTHSECWEWKGSIDREGYGRFRNNKKIVSAHRMAYILALGLIPEGLCACHHCDNRKCCNPTHLFTGTNIDNIKDRVRKSRSARGERNSQAKIGEAQVIEIRHLCKNTKMTQRKIAKIFGISFQEVNNICLGKKWKHLK